MEENRWTTRSEGIGESPFSPQKLCTLYTCHSNSFYMEGADFCIPTLPSDLDNIPSRNMLKKCPKWPCNLRDHPRILQVCHTHSYLNYQSSTSCHLLGLFRALPSSLKINEDRDSQLRKSESSLADLLPEPLPSSKAAIPLTRFTKLQRTHIILVNISSEDHQSVRKSLNYTKAL